MKNILCGGLLLLALLPGTAHEGYEKKNDRDGRVRVLNDNINRLSSRRGGDSTYTPAQAHNEIDTITFAKMTADGVPINGTCDDATFLRRVSLILTGRLPEPADVRAFHESTEANKRSAYIDQVLESDAYRTRMTFWFQEYFSSATVLLRAGQPYYNGFFTEAVNANKPLDQIARELMTSLGVTDQVGPANYYSSAAANTRLILDFWDNVAIYTSSKMLGVPLECISCHDGAGHLDDINLFLADKKRSEFWEMASWYSSISRRVGTRDEENNLILSLDYQTRNTVGYPATSDNGDRPIRDGGVVTPKYMFDGSIPEGFNNWQTTIADKIVGDRQFARNWANRLWGHVFGLAMVEPMDSFDPYRIDPDYPLPEGWESQVLDLALLEHMTDRMITNGYDLKESFRYMLNSATFQMSSEWLPGNWQEAYAPYYTRYLPRHMTSEEVYDSVMVSLGTTTALRQFYFGGVPAVAANYAHELIDNAQPRRGNNEVRNFLNAFGRGNRYDQPRTNQGGIAQALMLMNSPVVNNGNLLRDGRIRTYLDAGLTEAEIIAELYLDVYAREASSEEIAAMQTQLASFNTTEEKAQTALWLLINLVEFTFIY